MKLPERLLMLRQERNLSQKALALEMGMALNTYVRYERGEREPTASTLMQIAEFYGVTLRSEERRGGKECLGMCRWRGGPAR